jgi:hypothetical protein
VAPGERDDALAEVLPFRRPAAEPYPIELAVRALGRALNGRELQRTLTAAVAEGPERLAELLRHLEGLKRVAQLAIGELARALEPAVRRERLVVDGLGSFEWQGGTIRKAWDHDAILSRLFEIATSTEYRLDPDTGELEPEAEALLRAMVSAARFEWRAGKADGRSPGLRALGIEPDDHCQAERGRGTVRATWADGALDELLEPDPWGEQ